MSFDCRVKVRGLRREAIAKHGKAADRFLPCGFVLQYIPVLGQETIFKSDNIGRNPGRWPSHPSETAMCDHIVAICDDELVFIAQGIWRRADKVEQSLASRRNVRAVLDVLRRPEAFCCCVVAFVEERIEGLENDCLVLFGCCLGHIQLLVSRDGWWMGQEILCCVVAHVAKPIKRFKTECLVLLLSGFWHKSAPCGL